MVSIKMYILLSILMIFMKFNHSYCTQTMTCYNNIQTYFKYPLDSYTGATILNEIFESVSSANFSNVDIWEYMELVFSKLKINCTHEICGNGFSGNDKEKNPEKLFYDIAYVNIVGRELTTKYILHLMEHITLEDDSYTNELNAYTFCESRETCTDKIERDIPDIEKCGTNTALFEHIFLKVVIDNLREEVAKDYVLLLAKQVSKKKYYKIENPKEFCKRITSTSENSSSFSKKKSTTKRDCTNEVKLFFSDSASHNISKGFENLSRDTLQNHAFARQYMEYLVDFIQIDESTLEGRLPFGWNHIEYCREYERKQQ